MPPPSLAHEVVLELVRLDGELARALIGGAIPLRAWKPQSAPADFVQYPTQRRADHVTLFRDARHRARLAVIIEVQGKIDPGKKHSWPAYLVEARARFRCPTYLVVIALRANVVEWARASIEIGHPGFTLTPIVISKAQIPLISTPRSARLHPGVAVVSAIAHRDPTSVAASLEALGELPSDLQRICWDAIVSVLSPTKRRAAEELMDGYVYRSKIALEIQANGRKEGIVQGRARVALDLAKDKLGTLSAQQQAAIARLAEDAKKLSSLVVRLGRARNQAEARSILAKLCPPARAPAGARRRSRPAARA